MLYEKYILASIFTLQLEDTSYVPKKWRVRGEVDLVVFSLDVPRVCYGAAPR